MSVVINPALKIDLTGEGKVTTLSKLIQWTSGGKLEQTFIIKSTDASKVIYPQVVDNIRYIVFYSDSPFDLTITVGSQTIVENVRDLFVWAPDVDIRDSISSVLLSTTADNDITVEMRIYGESV